MSSWVARTLPPETCAVVFFWRGLIRLCSFSFLAPVELFFEQVERLQFLTRAELFLFCELQFFLLCEIRPKAADAQIT